MEFFTSRHAGPTQKPRLALCRKANLRAQRGSRPAHYFNAPYKISELKITPLRPASLPPSGLALHSPQASQTHSPPPPAASRPRGCRSVQSAANPSAHGPPPNPIRQGLGAPRPISDPRRCCPRCRQEYAHLRDLPRCGDPPIVKSTCWDNHRENKNLGISATFLRLRTLPCPGKAK